MTEMSTFEDRFADQLRAYAAPAARPPRREAVANAVEAARNVHGAQRRSWWPVWTSNRTNAYSKLIVAAMLVVAVVGYQFLPRSIGVVGQPTIAPSPSPTLLARGNFVAGYAIDIDAVAHGSRVTGRLTASEEESDAAFTVDLQCTRTTEDGLTMIGGVTTESTTGAAPVGTFAAIVLKPGSPVRATIWSQRGGFRSQAPSCLAYLDEQLPERRWILGEDWLWPIEGTVELGANVTPAPSGERLARGHLAPREWGSVEFAAFREGSSVTGRMTLGDETGRIDDMGYLKVDLQCARTTEDGLTMIGGFVTDGAGRRFRQFHEGTLAAVGLKRRSPVRTAILIGAIPSMPGTESTDCLAYLDAWLLERRTNPNDEWSLGDGPDAVEFGP
jgi:hypothetical protein